MDRELALAVAEKINKLLKRERELAKNLRNYDVVKKIKQIDVNGKLACIDGGLDVRNYFFVDLVFIKTGAVIYEISASSLKNSFFYPELINSEVVAVTRAVNDLELGVYVNLLRQTREVERAIEIIEKFKPDFIALDGSIIPHYSYVPHEQPVVENAFNMLIERYRKLFRLCKSTRINLFGLVKESRGSRFLQIVSNYIDDDFYSKRDTSVLNFLLKKGERTVVFDYAEDKTSHPILKYFPDIEVKSFYLKNAAYDHPLRIDFLWNGEEELANEISSLILSFTIDETNNQPTFLLEIDKKVRMSSDESDLMNSIILSNIDFPFFKKTKRWI